VRTEPELDPARLLELLRDRYRLASTGLTFVPYGIDSWSYVATSRDGRRVFVKLSQDAAFDAPDVALLAALHARGVAVPRPIADRDGRFLNPLDGYVVQVLDYLDGRSLESERAWPDDLYAAVADTVAAVHGSTDAVRHLVERVERYELPFLDPFAETLTALERGAELPAGDDPSLVSLRELVRPRQRAIREGMARLERLRDRARVGPHDEVLCHTDIWGSNLLLSGDGVLYLLDWNGALLAPREHDLFMFAGTTFFPPERFGWFLERYAAGCGPVRLDAETFGLYLYRRVFEDLASFVRWIADHRVEAMPPQAMLTIVADNLDDLPQLEGLIRAVAKVLAARKVSV